MTLPSPHRGEVWMVNFSPSRGSEQRGVRPAWVIQNDGGNEYAATTIIAAQILTIDKSRLRRRVGTLSQEVVDKVNAAIKISLDLA